MPDSHPPQARPTRAAVSPAERRRRLKILCGRGSLVAFAVLGVVLLRLAPHLADERARDTVYGGAVVLLLATAVLVILLARGRRGHDTMLSREMDGMGDERDKAVKRRMWTLAGRLAFVFMLILFVVSFTPLPVSWLIKTGFPVYSVVVASSRFYYDRTM